jgi:hypothetical protein
MAVALTSFKITRLPILMPMACQDFVFCMGEGNREEREYSFLCFYFHKK